MGERYKELMSEVDSVSARNSLKLLLMLTA
jgi:hypothetical protein